jgi:hypothetical protein
MKGGDILADNVTNVKEEIIEIGQSLNKEDQQFQKLLQNFSVLAKHIKKDLNSNVQVTNTFNKSFDRTDVRKWMDNPAKYEKKLRDLSRFLYDSSLHYKRLVQYFATMPTYDHIVEPYGITEYSITKDFINNVQKKYINTINYLDVMNLKHELARVSERCWVDDIGFFYEYRTKDSFFLDILPTDYCAISSIEDGVNNVSFSFNYFDTYPKDLERYAPEFKEKYELYKKDKRNNKWQELDPKKSFCIKINESIDYAIPPFCAIFDEIYELEDYRNLQLARTEMENYMIIVAKIPYLQNAEIANSFALEMNKAIEYFNLAMNEMPELIGGMLSPFDSVEALKVERKDNSLDLVANAEREIYNASGTSKILFNSDNASGAALTKSIVNDSTIVFKLLRQYERWLNRKLKDENKVIKFKVTLLDITKYNQSDIANMYKEAATLGLPCKTLYCASIGMSPSSVLNMTFLENDVMKITEKFIPLQSAYQTNVNDKGGNPGVNEDDLTAGGQDAIDRDTNNPDNRA